jgi:hypothetical protein
MKPGRGGDRMRERQTLVFPQIVAVIVFASLRLCSLPLLRAEAIQQLTGSTP